MTSAMGTSQIYQTTTTKTRGPRDFSEAFPEGLSWETGCNRNGSNVTATFIYT